MLTPPPFIGSSRLRVEGGKAKDDFSDEHDFKCYSTQSGAYGVIAKDPICRLDERPKGSVTIRTMQCHCSRLHHHHLPSLHLYLRSAPSLPIPPPVGIMYATPVSRNIAGRRGGPPHSKSFADALKIAALGHAKSVSDSHYRVEVSEQQSTPGAKAAWSLLSNLGWGSCIINATTTFANKGDGSPAGKIQLASSRFLASPGEVGRFDYH